MLHKQPLTVSIYKEMRLNREEVFAMHTTFANNYLNFLERRTKNENYFRINFKIHY